MSVPHAFSADFRPDACRSLVQVPAGRFEKCRIKGKNCRKSRFVCRFQIRIATRAFFGLQSPPRAGQPARRKSLWKSLSYPAARLRRSGAISTLLARMRAISCPSSQILIYLVLVPCSAYRRHAAKYRASRTPSGVPSACQNGRRATAAGRS